MYRDRAGKTSTYWINNKETISKTMLMKRHQRIAPIFTDEFWGTH